MSSVPVSQYEALRAEMRSLVQQAQQVQEIATQVISTTSSTSSTSSTNNQIRRDEPEHDLNPRPMDFTMESLSGKNCRQESPPSHLNLDYEPKASTEADGMASEDECGRVPSAQMSVSSEPIGEINRPVNALYHGTWPVERSMWNAELTNPDSQHTNSNHNMDQASVLSFASSSGGAPLDRVLGSPERLSRRSMQQLEAKVDMVYSLLAMLGGQEHADMGDTLLALSTSPESCLAMRQSGCIPLLVQLVQSDKDLETRKKASQALRNLVHAQTDEKLRRRETRVLKLLEQARAYTEALKNNTEFEMELSSSSSKTQDSADSDKHPVPTIANLMKHSFDEGHRQAICQLGGIHIIASLVEAEHTSHGCSPETSTCVLLRRYACMALTNLTFGDSGNKALLCSFREFMRALVVQLQSPSDELRQVTASVLRNLSWRADQTSKEILREVGAVAGLMKAGMATTKENTLKSILSALWNLSAHCTENKLEICAVDEGLSFLVEMLSYVAPSKSLTINENAGGILRNISSQIAVRDDYREILRKHNCLQILLDQLKSPSLTIVSNACGTLWNLSAKNQVDQEALWQMGAPAMLRSLNHSKHKMIATGSSAALKNLLNSRPSHSLLPQMDSTAKALDLPVLPTLGARKQKALLRDLDQNLSETYENIEKDSPTKTSKTEKMLFERTEKFIGGFLNKRNKSSKNVVKSESYEFTSHTDVVYGDRKTRSEVSNQSDLCNGFSSLTINEEPSTCFQNEMRSSDRKDASFGESSLVYANTSQIKGAFISVRNNYSDSFPDDLDASERPVDFSRKYVECKVPTAAKHYAASSKKESEKCAADKKGQVKGTNKETLTNYGIYAETDLDQPTDYSLRYAEDDSDSDVCDTISKHRSEFVQDTIKTYCTEGTPYETPLNFSTSTSMSDLRIDSDKNEIDNDRSKNSKQATIPKLSHLNEKDHCSVEDISDLDNRPKNETKITSEVSSGILSPEKPINYCEEGTPGYFSRVSSLGSLNSIPATNEIKNDTSTVAPADEPTEEKTCEDKNNTSSTEGKAVKFVESGVNYAEQTPLMFSRSSSLGSLDSAEQHSIHDDRSSIVSDFSRLTSGIVSPSELPDSPTQTVPPSPRPRKTPLEYPTTSNVATTSFQRNSRRPQPTPRTINKPSVFEDNTTKFKEESTPVQFSTATSMSSLTIDDQDEPPVRCDIKIFNDLRDDSDLMEEQHEKLDSESEKKDNSSQFNIQLSENDEDDDILADCINIGMQNNRHTKESSPSVSKIPSSVNYKLANRPRGIPLPRTGIPSLCSSTPPQKLPAEHSDSTRTYYTEGTPAVLSNAGSISNLSVLSIHTDNKSRKDYLSDDSSNLSGDNDNILAECIQSGMPKAKLRKQKEQIPCSSNNLQTSTPIKNCIRIHNIDSNAIEKKRALSSYLESKDEFATFAVENSPCQFSLRSSLSDLTVDGSTAGPIRSLDTSSNAAGCNTSKASSTAQGPSGTNHLPSLDVQFNMSRQESLSSLSVESFESIETEQALLEQCISSGMPKSKQNIPTNISREREKPVGVATKHFNHKLSSDANTCRKQSYNVIDSKNVKTASVARNINQLSPDVPKMETDVDVTERKVLTLKVSPMNVGTTQSMPLEEDIMREVMKSGCEKSHQPLLNNDISNDIYANETENCAILTEDKHDDIVTTTSFVDNRMLDPAAMIESLDRFTAELVSQASCHLQSKEENKYNISQAEGGDTWNEDISPNDVTFPSISGSVPNVITFESNKNEIYQEEVIGPESNDSIDTSTLTESTLIAMEATKIATTFHNEAEMTNSIVLELDRIQPPSQLNSLSRSETDVILKCKLAYKKTPAGLIRRALTNSLNQGSSLESIDNQSLTNLDQINPPSLMSELVDMDGSMTSVASLTSDAADIHMDSAIVGNIQPNIMFDTKYPGNQQMNNSTDLTSITDLDNVNPPSLFNEITDMCNSLADIASENIETEEFGDCNSALDSEITLYSDANSVTPVLSELSSAETTPKKVNAKHRKLTPKQRRQLSKERYKTYTVAADVVMQNSSQHFQDDAITEDFETVNCYTESFNTAAENFGHATFSRGTRETSSREKELNTTDIQTQIFDNEPSSKIHKSQTNDVNMSPVKAPRQIPLLSRINIRKKNQNRRENKDRFKTRVIRDPSILTQSNINCNDIQLLVQTEANVVLKTLKETKSRADELLDCETLSLVSNDDDSEHNSSSSMNYRTYHKSWGLDSNNIPIVQSSPQRIPSDLENHSSVDTFKDQGVSDRNESNDDVEPQLAKPRIVKPTTKNANTEYITIEDEGQNKCIRGKRKPLYSKVNTNNKLPLRNLKPNKQVISNVGVTASKLNAVVKTELAKQPKQVITKPSTSQSKILRMPTNYKQVNCRSNSSTSLTNNTKVSPARSVNKSVSSNHIQLTPRNKSPSASSVPAPLERQNTFTKDGKLVKNKPTEIPRASSASRIAKAIPQYKLTGKMSVPSSTSSDKIIRAFNNKANGRPAATQPLKCGTVKKTTTEQVLKCNTNTNGQNKITSKIASLWRKVEESKKQLPKRDNRVWIENYDASSDQTTNTNANESINTEDNDVCTLANSKSTFSARETNSHEYECTNDSEELSF